MKRRENHEAAEIPETRPVQLQGDDCGPPGWALPLDFRGVRRPSKAIGPLVTARVEQRRSFSRGRIERGRLGGLVAVAALAGKGQLFGPVGSALASRENMLGRVRRGDQSGRRKAIRTPETGSLWVTRQRVRPSRRSAIGGISQPQLTHQLGEGRLAQGG